MWRPFDHGQSLGQRGAEDGVVIADEEHTSGARITLERGGRTASWSITCAIHHTFTHTAFASSETEARGKFSEMKRDLVGIMEEGSSAPCYEKMRLFMDVY